jgi:oligosaccharide repeat unit polymerase
MIFIPLIWFSLLLIFILRKKKRVEISAVITIAYIATSIFAVLINVNKLYRDSGMTEVSLELTPTLLYCFLITITILPFTILPALKKDNLIQIKNEKLFDYVIYFYLGVFVLFILFFGGEIVYRVQNPDIAALRLLIVDGEDDLGFSNYSGISRILARLVFIFGSSAMFLHVFYFYSLAFLKRSFKFNVAILLFSTMPIMIGMLSMDRSKTVYWMMSFIALAVFFWGAFDPLRKKQVKSTFIKFFVVFILYLTLITTARYGEHDIGAVNSLIVYAGMSFNNFCLFYDKLNLPGISLEMVTPLLNTIIGSSDDIKRSIIYDRSIDTNVFASFSGMLIREIGVWGSILYSFIYFFLATFIFKNKRKYNITKIFLVVILLYIPYLGIFGLYYASPDREMTAWVILILCYFLKKRPKNRNFNAY